MKNTWWRTESDLVDEQMAAIERPLSEQLAIMGPPGSGKTNLLLLRAKYHYLFGNKNIAIVVFTKTLRDFVIAGCHGYGLPQEIVMTAAQWKARILKELGGSFPDQSLPHEERYQALTEAAASAVKQAAGRKYFDAVFVDEVQDYSGVEMRMFAGTTACLHVSGDAYQRIHQETDSLAVLGELNLKEVRLTKHFRNGYAICRLADSIMQGEKGYTPSIGSCNYDESKFPCTVTEREYADDAAMFSDLATMVQQQLAVYTDDFVGILVPKAALVSKVADAMRSAGLGDSLVVEEDGTLRFAMERRLVVATVHSAKGLEFRAVTLAYPELLKKFQAQRKLTYTGITRCKTSLVIARTKGSTLAPYFAGALSSLTGTRKLPSRKELFS